MAANSPASFVLRLEERSVLFPSSSSAHAWQALAAGLGSVVAADPGALVVVALAAPFLLGRRSGDVQTWAEDPSPPPLSGFGPALAWHHHNVG